MSMKLVKIQIELVTDDYVGFDKESISDYLNDKLWSYPEFFGDFWTESIVEVEEDEWCNSVKKMIARQGPLKMSLKWIK